MWSFLQFHDLGYYMQVETLCLMECCTVHETNVNHLLSLSPTHGLQGEILLLSDPSVITEPDLISLQSVCAMRRAPSPPSLGLPQLCADSAGVHQHLLLKTLEPPTSAPEPQGHSHGVAFFIFSLKKFGTCQSHRHHLTEGPDPPFFLTASNELQCQPGPQTCNEKL